MIIETYENGYFNVNTYLLISDSGECIVIDPGKRIDTLIDKIKTNKLRFLSILITHPHIDHVEGVHVVKKSFPDTPVLLDADAAPLLPHIAMQARLYGLEQPAPVQYDKTIGEGDITIGSFSIRCISTPGHCPGSLSFLIENSVFTGDALFQGTIGRTDIPGGNFQQLKQSIKEKLYTLPDTTRVYPGHSEPTSIGYEKLHNQYV